jgi:tetratricopeptide (TPR) repeat protein
MSGMGQDGWTGDLAGVCEAFQLDLSCLLDGELEDAAAGRAMLHLEECGPCRSFFDETRRCARLNRDLSEPQRLIAHLSALTGSFTAAGLEIVHQLASILYQLGKAYVLAAVDPDYRVRVFEEAVPVDPLRSRGRGFVDGVTLRGEEVAGLDLKRARGLLNGRLQEIDSPLEKGRQLLREALEVDPGHEEARIYLAFLHAHEGKPLLAAEQYRGVFRTALREENRGHAAVQLGRMHVSEGNHRRALACFRWVLISGLDARDERFFFAGFNVGHQYALMGRRGRALEAFRRLIDRHPDRLADISDLFARSHNLLRAIESQPGFLEALVETCPELFGGQAAGRPGASGAGTEESNP